MDQSCVRTATDGGLAGITLIIEPPSPPLLLCHLSSASNVILTPGPALTSLHQAAALREASHSSPGAVTTQIHLHTAATADLRSYKASYSNRGRGRTAHDREKR